MPEHDAAHLQALSLVALALEGDRQAYAAQWDAVEQPHSVGAALVLLLVRAVPLEARAALAGELRGQLLRYTK